MTKFGSLLEFFCVISCGNMFMSIFGAHIIGLLKIKWQPWDIKLTFCVGSREGSDPLCVVPFSIRKSLHLFICNGK